METNSSSTEVSPASSNTSDSKNKKNSSPLFGIRFKKFLYLSAIILGLFIVGMLLFRWKLEGYIAPLGIYHHTALSLSMDSVYVLPSLNSSPSLPALKQELLTANAYQKVHATFTINFHTYYWLCMAFGLILASFAAVLLLYMGKDGWRNSTDNAPLYLFTCIAYAAFFRGAIEIFELKNNYQVNSAAFFDYGLLADEIKTYLSTERSAFYPYTDKDSTKNILPQDFAVYVEKKIRDINIHTVNYSPDKIANEIGSINKDVSGQSP